MNTGTLLASFLGGILSILSPCILPIIPSFIGYITGISLTEAAEKSEKATQKILTNTLFFGIGFLLIFLLFGAVIGTVGQLLLLNRPLFQKIGGIIIIFFGFQITGILKFKFLNREKTFTPSNFIKKHQLEKLKLLRSFLTGIFFAFGWAPCYGPIVGTIFTLAATQESFNQAMLLFFFYSLGFIIPLLIMAFFIAHANKKLGSIKKFAKYSSLISGTLVIILGLLLLTDNFAPLVNHLNFIYNQNNFSLI